MCIIWRSLDLVHMHASRLLNTDKGGERLTLFQIIQAPSALGGAFEHSDVLPGDAVRRGVACLPHITV